jgi:hypothetical protein
MSARGWALSAVVATTLGGCAESSAQPSSPPPPGERHEVFCGSVGNCHQAAGAYCRSHYGTTQYDVVGRVPGRLVLVITCG